MKSSQTEKDLQLHRMRMLALLDEMDARNPISGAKLVVIVETGPERYRAISKERAWKIRSRSLLQAWHGSKLRLITASPASNRVLTESTPVSTMWKYDW